MILHASKFRFSLRLFLIAVAIICLLLGLLSLRLYRLNRQEVAAAFFRENGGTTLVRDFDGLYGHSYDNVQFSQMLWPGMNKFMPGTFTILNPNTPDQISGFPDPPSPANGWHEKTFGKSFFKRDLIAWIGKTSDLSVDDIADHLEKMAWVEQVIVGCIMNVKYENDGSFKDNSTCSLSDDEIEILKARFPTLDIRKSLWRRVKRGRSSLN